MPRHNAKILSTVDHLSYHQITNAVVQANNQFVDCLLKNNFRISTLKM